jgi:hypothetical protein
MGFYFNDPSGLGSWWINDDETPASARKRIEKESGTVLMNLPENDWMLVPGNPAEPVPTNDPQTIARRAMLLQGAVNDITRAMSNLKKILDENG